MYEMKATGLLVEALRLEWDARCAVVTEQGNQSMAMPEKDFVRHPSVPAEAGKGPGTPS